MTEMGTQMTKAEIVKIATAAAGAPGSNSKAVRTFRELAKRAGFEGRSGGWIYLNNKSVAHGWSMLAHRVSIGIVDAQRFVNAAPRTEIVEANAQLDAIEARMTARNVDHTKALAECKHGVHATLVCRPCDAEAIERQQAAQLDAEVTLSPITVDIERVNAKLATAGRAERITAAHVERAGMVAAPTANRYHITVRGHRYEFEMTPPAADGWRAVRAPGVVDFAVKTLDEARDALRDVYGMPDTEH
jgi:hypothetical protein